VGQVVFGDIDGKLYQMKRRFPPNQGQAQRANYYQGGIIGHTG
jgi:hypothetical protein